MDGFDKIKWIATAIAVGFFILGCVTLIVQPDTQAIDMSTQVEDMAREKGVPFDRKGSLEYRFSESEGFGGAGGQSGTLSAATSEADLVQTADDEEASIHYTLKANYINAEKFYWTYADGTYFYWKDSYDIPLGYAVTEKTNARLSLTKNVGLGIAQNAFCGGMLGFIAFIAMLLLTMGRVLFRR